MEMDWKFGSTIHASKTGFIRRQRAKIDPCPIQQHVCLFSNPRTCHSIPPHGLRRPSSIGTGGPWCARISLCNANTSTSTTSLRTGWPSLFDCIKSLCNHAINRTKVTKLPFGHFLPVVECTHCVAEYAELVGNRIVAHGGHRGYTRNVGGGMDINTWTRLEDFSSHLNQ